MPLPSVILSFDGQGVSTPPTSEKYPEQSFGLDLPLLITFKYRKDLNCTYGVTMNPECKSNLLKQNIHVQTLGIIQYWAL